MIKFTLKHNRTVKSSATQTYNTPQIKTIMTQNLTISEQLTKEIPPIVM